MPVTRKIIVIGGGIAGLCTAVYARKCGYEVELLEMHDTAGGLATSWHRGGYVFETCLHWLMGSNPDRPFHQRWREVFDIDRLKFVQLEEFTRIETEHGESLSVYADVDRMEAEFLRRAPEDTAEVRRLASAVRRLTGFELPELPGSGAEAWLGWLRAVPYLPTLRKFSRITSEAYGRRFKNPLLRRFFGDGELAQLSALAVVLSLAWRSRRDAGYPIGGSQAVIRLIEERLRGPGSRIRFQTRVRKILVERDVAIGVELEGGETVSADWVISAADGHATIYEMLGGRYRTADIDRTYATLRPFPSYLQVSLGVAWDLADEPGFFMRVLHEPLRVDPATELGQISFRFFHYDPSFAPPGKTAVTCILLTRNFAFWARLRNEDAPRYQDEKRRVADRVIDVLDRRLPGIRQAIEVSDVSTPASVIRYTGNWQGSMEGWLLTPARGFGPLPSRLPGLSRFLMVGQWVLPGGGLPSGLVTARAAIRAACREDGRRFAPRDHEMA
jgi:phytoene dehydrogenase-like protein